MGELVEHLWPDLEADAGRNALDQTLLRLRRFLKHRRALLAIDGTLSLDPALVWLDTWAFAQCCNRLQLALERGVVATQAEQRLLAHYPGAFLSHCSCSWSLVTRERLRSRFERMVVALGAALIAAGSWIRATALYSSALEVEPLVEEFHRQLMHCLLAQQRDAEALLAYLRCRRLLKQCVGIAPSPLTQAVVKNLLR
jgi:DNA-binding SARP family transcriptional activator